MDEVVRALAGPARPELPGEQVYPPAGEGAGKITRQIEPAGDQCRLPATRPAGRTRQRTCPA